MLQVGDVFDPPDAMESMLMSRQMCHCRDLGQEKRYMGMIELSISSTLLNVVAGILIENYLRSCTSTENINAFSEE